MQIQRVKFRGFGRWTETKFSFEQGINLIEAPNESGKSTIIQGIFALLYGSKKEGVKKQVKADWYNQYLPWIGNDYGGEIDYSIQDHSYRLIRTLFLPQDKAQLMDMQHNLDVTKQFSLDVRKERLFLEKQIGFTYDHLRRVIFLTPQYIESRKEESEKQVQLIEKIKAAMHGEDIQLQPVIKNLEKKINEIGNAKSETKKLGVALARSTELGKEVTRLKNDYTLLMQDIHRLSELDKEKKLLQQKKQEVAEEQTHHQLIENKRKAQEIDQKISQFKHEYTVLEQFDEEEAYQKINLLEEFMRLEEQSRLSTENDIELTEEYRMEVDISEVISLEKDEKELQEKVKCAEKHLKIARIKNTSITAILVLTSAIFLYFWQPIFCLVPLLLGTFFIYYDRSAPLSRFTQRYYHEVNQIKAELNRTNILKKQILQCWSVNSLAELYAKWEEFRKKINKVENQAHELLQSEKRMEEIHQEVKHWLVTFVQGIPFEPQQWIREIRLLIRQTKELQKALYKLEVSKANLRSEPLAFGDVPSYEKELHKMNEECAKLEGRIETLSEMVSALPQKETEWELAQKKAAELEKEKQALSLCRDVLLQIGAELHETIAPQLIPNASKWLKVISGDRYDQLLIQLQKEVELRVFVPETGENLSINVLSKGTIDQILLSFRLSLIQFYASYTGVILPLILDDYFVHFDEERLQKALVVLAEISKRGHQIILCSCGAREREGMKRLGIKHHFISIEKPAYYKTPYTEGAY